MATQSYESYCEDLYSYQPPHCADCQNAATDRFACSEYLQEVVEQLYGKIPLDKGNLEHCLDELCRYFYVKPIFNAYGPMIERKNGLCEVARSTTKGL